LVEKSTTGAVPVGTVKALISLEFTRTDGSDSDGLADNLFFGLVGAPGGGGGTTGSGGTTGGPGCTYSLSSYYRQIGNLGASDHVSVQTQPGCAWSTGLVPNPTLVQDGILIDAMINTGNGTGPADFVYTIPANPGNGSKLVQFAIGGEIL